MITLKIFLICRNFISEPGIPGPIDKERSDFHASDVNSGISIYWTRPSGGVSGYKIEVSDGTNSQLSNSTSADFTFRNPWLKNGHRYNVTIQAKSETYGSGNGFVLGEEYREEIKTVVTGNVCESTTTVVSYFTYMSL